jgi:hypothetical protein
MLGHDGAGPKGCGPMTSRGSGYYTLKTPRIGGEPQTGFADLSGRPLTLLPGSPQVDVASLHLETWQVQVVLGGIDSRIAILDAIGQGIGGLRHNADRGDPKRCLDEATV